MGVPPHMAERELLCSSLTPLLRFTSLESLRRDKPPSAVGAAVLLFQSARVSEAAFYLSKYFGIELISSSLTTALSQELHPTPAPLPLAWLQPQAVSQPGLEGASTLSPSPACCNPLPLQSYPHNDLAP